MGDVSPFILCSGSGARLWPLSPRGIPKQFLKLTGKETLLEQASRPLQAPCSATSVLGDHRHHESTEERLLERFAKLGASP